MQGLWTSTITLYWLFDKFPEFSRSFCDFAYSRTFLGPGSVILKSKDFSRKSRSVGALSLAPGKFECNFRHVIFKQILVIDGWGICCEIALLWISLDFTDDQSTLVQVKTWCRQATSHYLSQCWPRSLLPYGVTRPQWVKGLALEVIFICCVCQWSYSTGCLWETGCIWFYEKPSFDMSIQSGFMIQPISEASLNPLSIIPPCHSWHQPYE